MAKNDKNNNNKKNNKKQAVVESSDSNDSDSSCHSSDSERDKKKEIEKLKFLSKIFPSKYMKDKLKKVEKRHEKPTRICNKKKKAKTCYSVSSQDDDDDDEEENENIVLDKDDDCSSSECTEITEDSTESEEESRNNKQKKKSQPFNIILEFGGKRKGQTSYYDDDEDDSLEDDSYWEDISEEDDDINGIDTENEDDPVSSDSDDSTDESCAFKGADLITLAAKTKENEELLEQLKTLKDTKSVQKCIDVCEKEIQECKKQVEKKTTKHKEKNSRIFRKIIRDKNSMNDVDFFKKLAVDDQKRIIKELREVNKVIRIEKPYGMTLLETNIPVVFKAAAMKKINLLRRMDPGSGEYYKIKNWVDTFMSMPFGKYESLPVSFEDGVDKCHEFMENSQKILDQAVYGLNDAKMQIMQMLGQLLTNPKAVGAAIAIHGPPGTGKTSLVKEGISKILNRPFAFIALGGATDSSFLEGHSYTYEGSTWGKIVQILIDSKCMNPVIYFDELDKISDTPKGEEIAGILTHLTDTSQNSQFHDKYFSEVDFDLSKCLFIFSYNDESKVNPILRDRMYRIQTKGYNQKQKTVISNNYLLPKIREQVKFSTQDIIIPDSVIHYMIDNYCNKEDGVRNLKRCLEIIHTKLNLYRLMKPGSNLFEEDMSLKVEFPFTITKDIVDKLIKKDKENTSVLYGLYV